MYIGYVTMSLSTAKLVCWFRFTRQLYLEVPGKLKARALLENIKIKWKEQRKNKIHCSQTIQANLMLFIW